MSRRLDAILTSIDAALANARVLNPDTVLNDEQTLDLISAKLETLNNAISTVQIRINGDLNGS